jgi:LysR family transcriptional regulator, benzoate and cis,cis-muconate-responsive activator of ben and cat genes
MDLRHLRYFQAVATLLNFSRAAEQLHVAQPAISRQIRDLEDEIGARLFRRSSSRVQLTEAGQYFLNQTDQLLELLNNAVAKARQIGEEATGQLNIGSDWNIPAPISVSVRKFRKLYPKFHVNFVELPSHEHMRAARSGQIHVGFVSSGDIDSRDDLDLVRVFSTEVIVVLPDHHRLAHRERVRIAELKDERWITPHETLAPRCHDWIKELLRSAQCNAKFGKTANSLQGMLALVAADEGICLVGKQLLVNSTTGIRLVPTDCPNFELFAVSLKNPSSIPAASYLEVLREESTQWAVPFRAPKQLIESASFSNPLEER